MASEKNSDIKCIFEFEKEMWEFMKSTWIPEYGEEYCKYVKDEANKLLVKYRHDFCIASICLYLEYLKWKHKKYKGETNLDFNTWLYADREKIFKTKLRSMNE